MSRKEETTEEGNLVIPRGFGSNSEPFWAQGFLAPVPEKCPGFSQSGKHAGAALFKFYLSGSLALQLVIRQLLRRPILHGEHTFKQPGLRFTNPLQDYIRLRQCQCQNEILIRIARSPPSLSPSLSPSQQHTSKISLLWQRLGFGHPLQVWHRNSTHEGTAQSNGGKRYVQM